MLSRKLAFIAGTALGLPALAQITVSHSLDPNLIAPGSSVACAGGGGTTGVGQTTTENNYWRSYNLNTFPAVTAAGLAVTQVRFGVENHTNPLGDIVITVNLYRDTNGGAPTSVGTDLVLVGTGTVNVPPGLATFHTCAVTGTFAKTDTLVAQVSIPTLAPQSPANAVFFIGANAAGQTGPSYISSTSCGLANPTDLAAINFPNAHVIIDVTGNTPGGITGRCCFAATGACQILTSASCTGSGGTYGGDGTNCTPNVCPQPPTGACCTIAGCSVVTPTVCTATGGVYQGNSSACTGQCPTAPVLFTNCNIKTGATTLSGVAAPAGAQWSEAARDLTDPTTANTTAGLGGNGALRLADDFVVPTGGQQIGYIRVYAYTTGATVPTATAATLEILNGSPVGAPSVVFGDQTTNRLAGVAFTDIYRTFNTVSAPVCNGATTVPGTTRRLQAIYIAVNQFLPAGTYWVNYNYTGANFSPPATSVTAIGRQCNPANSNALQFNAGWAPINDAGQGCLPSAVTQDMFFEVLGPAVAPPTCYADCDLVGGLTANDFICFLTKFNQGASYADCDTVGGLTANDFICFLTKYNQGCS